MLDKGRISSVQLLMLLITLERAFYLPAKIAGVAGPDGWFSVSIVASLYGLIVAGVALALGRRYPSRVLTEYLPEVLGRVPGKLLAAVYAVVLINFAFVVLNENSSFLHITILSRTPLTVLDTVTAIAAIYGAYLGIECIVRQNQLFWPVWMIAIVVVLALAAKDINLGNLGPVFENGLLPALKGGYYMSPWRGEVVLLLMLFPYLNQKQEAFKVALWVLGFLAVTSGATITVIVGVFGPLVTAHLVFPYDVLGRYVFIERMEILVVLIWLAGVVTKLALVYQCAGVAAASTLGLKNYRITLIPIAIATVILSKVFLGTYSQMTDFLFRIWPPYAAAVELVIPAIILLIAVVRKKEARTAMVAGSAGPDSDKKAV